MPDNRRKNKQRSWNSGFDKYAFRVCEKTVITNGCGYTWKLVY